MDQNAGQLSPEVGSVTAWIQRLSEEIEPLSSGTQKFDAVTPAPVCHPARVNIPVSFPAMR